jgi:hypothetical protein
MQAGSETPTPDYEAPMVEEIDLTLGPCETGAIIGSD